MMFILQDEVVKSTKSVYLKDYKLPDYTVKETKLVFELGHAKTRVSARYKVERVNPQAKRIWFDGDGCALLSARCDDVELGHEQVVLSDKGLAFDCDADFSEIEFDVEISPEKNTQLQGLYTSGKSLCTQCEAQGFRRIVYSLDRPDVLSTYDVTVVYDENVYPHVIAAGKLQEKETRQDGLSVIRFVDKTPKPTYLFALVAGKFNHIEESFTTKSGEEVKLHIHIPLQYPIAQAEFAMQSLRKSMVWDEKVFNCVYDLSDYHIVGFPDFNFGAMENKGLNIFNTTTLLAEADITTDAGYLRVLSVVGHEYFHNWTGNRIGCSNWFQLSLKEGLTTYREMRFACDSYGPSARLVYINALVDHQFIEDRGPTAHAVIPQSYQKIDNFYTSTIYTKGSEVLRMLEDIIGRENIDQGIQNYLNRYDGRAVTINEFLDEVRKCQAFDLDKFKRWYHQIGTPQVKVSTEYDGNKNLLKLKLRQSPPGNFQDNKPVLMPVKMRLWSQNGDLIVPEATDGIKVNDDGVWVVILEDEEAIHEIRVSEEEPIVSSFIGLSAPVVHSDDLSFGQRAALVAAEVDPYVKKISARKCWMQLLHEDNHENLQALNRASDSVLKSWEEHPDLVGLIALPSIQICQESGQGYDFDRLLDRHRVLEKHLATQWHEQWQKIFAGCQLKLQANYVWNKNQAALRQLRAFALKMILEYDIDANASKAVSLYHASDNLTDRYAALSALCAHDNQQSQALLEQFYNDANGQDLLLNQWLYLGAGRYHKDGLCGIQSIYDHEECDVTRPNRVMSWFSGWCHGNYDVLHNKDGSGYGYLQKIIEQVDKVNPFTSSRMLTPLLQFQYFDQLRQDKMLTVLQALSKNDLSDNVKEKLASVVTD